MEETKGWVDEMDVWHAMESWVEKFGDGNTHVNWEEMVGKVGNIIRAGHERYDDVPFGVERTQHVLNRWILRYSTPEDFDEKNLCLEDKFNVCFNILHRMENAHREAEIKLDRLREKMEDEEKLFHLILGPNPENKPLIDRLVELVASNK